VEKKYYRSEAKRTIGVLEEMFQMDWDEFDLDSLRHVNISNKGLTDLSPLVELTGMTGLVASDNPVVTLPNNLIVQGPATFDNLRITEFPNNIIVKGSLHLNGCKELETLPKKMTIHGDLDLNDCVKLKMLPNNLSVKGDLQLIGCTNIVEISQDIVIGGSLTLRGCELLERMPNNMIINGGLDIRRCTNLRKLPETLIVRDWVNLDHSGIECLPKFFSVGAVVDPDKLHKKYRINENANLTTCTDLITTPSRRVIVGHDLDLSGCVNLNNLPNSMIIGGSLALRGCKSLEKLPDHLIVRGGLELSFCDKIRHINDGVIVGGRIVIEGAGIIYIGRNVIVGEDIII